MIKLKYLKYMGLFLAIADVNAMSFLGSFKTPGTYDLPNMHITQIYSNILIDYQNVYFLGGALYKESAKRQQYKLKQQLINDLNKLSKFNIDFVKRMLAKIDSMPVTGRVRAELDPLVLASDFSKNIRLISSDTLFLPKRPLGVYVTGAVKNPQIKNNTHNKTVVNLIQKITKQKYDKSFFWLVQPDGHYEKVGYAYWNRDKNKFAAPGAVIYFGLDSSLTKLVAPKFNERMAKWLSSQRFSEVIGF